MGSSTLLSAVIGGAEHPHSRPDTEGTFNRRRMTATRRCLGKTPAGVLPLGDEVALDVRRDQVGVVSGEHVVYAGNHD